VNFDPAAPNAFAAAVQWLDSTLLGTIATAVAVIAVASIGFLLMSGRVDVRRAAQVIFGCFILFGASSIAAGIMRAADGAPVEIRAVPLPPLAAAPQTGPAAAYDPYAGAALPPR
jgi:type IV secretory pathway VirB2 component (pilin)